jgi:hypothetical protein
MSVALFALPAYLIVLSLCAAAYLIGAAILRHLSFANGAERVFVCTSFGIGTISHLVLYIGTMGWLTNTGVIMSLGVAVAASVLLLRKWRDSQESKPHSSQLKWLAVITGTIILSIVLLPIWMLPLYPPTDFDVTMYHLAEPKLWLQAHRVIVTPFLRLPIGPHLAHTLFATLMLAGNDLSPQILSLAATGLVATGLYGWGSRANGINAGILAAALWLGSPAVLAVAAVASYHTLASLFAFGSIYALANYGKTRQILWLFVASAFFGFAESTWSMTIYFVPVFAAALTYFILKEHQVQPLYVFVLGLLLGWGPALARATWYTRNPLFPLLTEFFGTGPWWTSQDVADLANNVRRFGLPCTLGNFLIIPYALIAHADKFQSRENYSIALSFLLPFLALRSALDKYVRWLGVIVLFYASCWFIFGQVMRYLLPIVPVLCFATAATISWLVDWICRGRHIISSSLIVVAAMAALWPGLSFARRETIERGSIPRTKVERDVYIASRIPQYRALAVANVSPGPLYSLYGVNAAYYSDGLFMGDWFGPGRYSQVLNSFANGKSLYNTLRRLGAKYFLMSLTHSPPFQLPYHEHFDNYFEPLFADASAELYRIRDSPQLIAANRPNLLRNADFDEIRGDWPIAWDHFGMPVVSAPGTGAFAAKFAVKVTNTDGLVQPVRVTPKETYELGLWAKGDAPKKLFRLQINWLNHDRQICSVFIRVYEATENWHSYAGRMTAPACAEIAQIYASGHAGNWVWMDSFVFRSVGGGPLNPEAHAPAIDSTKPK